MSGGRRREATERKVGPDLGKCQTQFEEKRAKIDAQAAKAAIACRYGDNGDQTVTDYDTGLMWEKKDGVVGGSAPTLPTPSSHCVNTLYTWFDAFAYVAGASANGTAIALFLAGHARLATADGHRVGRHLRRERTGFRAR